MYFIARDMFRAYSTCFWFSTSHDRFIRILRIGYRRFGGKSCRILQILKLDYAPILPSRCSVRKLMGTPGERGLDLGYRCAKSKGNRKMDAGKNFPTHEERGWAREEYIWRINGKGRNVYSHKNTCGNSEEVAGRTPYEIARERGMAFRN